MARVAIEKGEQAEFLAAVKEATSLRWQEIANLCGVSRWTLRDWRKEELRMSYEALMTLHKLSGVPLPTIIEVISEEEYRRRAGSKGARVYYELYGNPGTSEGRRKGGRKGLKELRRRARENPELYPRFRERKEILLPEKSPRLAELVGILLGDGEITDFQVRVTSHREKEAEYSRFVSELAAELFGVEAPLIPRENTYICNGFFRGGSRVPVEYWLEEGEQSEATGERARLDILRPRMHEGLSSGVNGYGRRTLPTFLQSQWQDVSLCEDLFQESLDTFVDWDGEDAG